MERIKSVRLFIRVIETGSFSKAAADLGMGQPAATRIVAQMEKQLGSRLLHRSTRGATPTEIGALYYEKCRLIVRHVDEARTVAMLLQSQVQGAMRVTSSVAFGRRVLVPMVMRFMRLHPMLHIDLNFDDRYVDLVEQGMDVAIRLGPLADSTLGARYLGLNPWVAVASNDYLQRRGPPADPSDLSGHDALVYSPVRGDARWNFTGPDGQQRSVPVEGPLRSNNLSALLAAARDGAGIAALPWYVAHESVERGAVVPLLARWTLPAQEIHAVYPSPRMVTAKVIEFVEWLQGQFGEKWWSEPR